MMNHEGGFIKSLKEKGHKITEARIAICKTLEVGSRPLSVQDILAILSKKKIMADKTTVYREIAFLLREGLIVEIRFQDRKKRYEVAEQDHHHHVVCTSCDSVEDVEIEDDLEKQERVIARQKGFKILSHSLEFFGLCESCQ